MADKYKLQLTGEQVDDALQQLNERVAEGWAVGERDGQPVSPSSPYHNNNARYYAEQAAANAARAEAAIPVGSESAVLFDRAQSLTDEQKAQARANISAGSSNENLLDNPYFIVCQKELIASTSTIYPMPAASLKRCVDRWTFARNSDASYRWNPAEGMLTRTGAGSNKTAGVAQVLESDLVSYLNRKPITLSALIDGEIVSGSIVRVNDTRQVFFTKSYDSNLSVVGEMTQLNTILINFATKSSANGKMIRAAKLERGWNSTLDSDVPASYCEELKKCQYYFRRIKGNESFAGHGAIGIASSGTDCLVPLPYMMRATPTATINGAIALNKGGGQPSFVSGVSVNGWSSSGICLNFESSDLEFATPYILFFSEASAYIDLSAEL